MRVRLRVLLALVVAGANVSACSERTNDARDTLAPAPPTGLSSDPISPSNDNRPRIRGTAEPDATVRLYTTADCSGAPVATGTAAAFASPGLAVTVRDNTITVFRATATDDAGDTSGCSEEFSDVEDSSMPETAILGGLAGTSRDTRATFTFSSSEPGTFECRLDGRAWAHSERRSATAYSPRALRVSRQAAKSGSWSKARIQPRSQTSARIRFFSSIVVSGKRS